jgi:hypothetical protein
MYKLTLVLSEPASVALRHIIHIQDWRRLTQTAGSGPRELRGSEVALAVLDFCSGTRACCQ